MRGCFSPRTHGMFVVAADACLPAAVLRDLHLKHILGSPRFGIFDTRFAIERTPFFGGRAHGRACQAAAEPYQNALFDHENAVFKN